jgi:hypothetical protein
MKAKLRLRLAVGVFVSFMNGAAWADSLIGAGLGNPGLPLLWAL